MEAASDPVVEALTATEEMNKLKFRTHSAAESECFLFLDIKLTKV